ncbi:hypothetical protein BH09VER1_BH09VER1_07800 [soil metagenome]
MNVLTKLRKQMTVVSNHRYQESVGGYRVYFVGTGSRQVDYEGWWKTKLDFYSIDAVGFAQRVRVGGGKEEFLRCENAVCLFAPNVLFEEFYEKPRRFEDAWVVFRPCAEHHPLKKVLGKKGYGVFQDDHRLIRQRIHEVAQIASPDTGLRYMAQAAFLQILAYILQAVDGQVGPLQQGQPVRHTFRDKVLGLLTDDLRRDPSVEELARQLSVSRSTLSHRFSAEMGETMVQLKNRLRIQRAQELMSDTGKQLKEIAFEVGFDDPAYFTRLFTRQAGVSPGAYRKVARRGIKG